jgi:hypothetical protein
MSMVPANKSAIQGAKYQSAPSDWNGSGFVLNPAPNIGEFSPDE